MSTLKTAITVDSRLRARVDDLARRKGKTRSAIFSQAAEELLRREESRQMFEEINAAYADDEENEEDLRFLDAVHRANAHVLDPW